MIEIEIEQPNGYLKDSDGKVAVRFGDWSVGTHKVADHIDPSKTEYVDGPKSHDTPVHEDYSIQH